jgi:glycosyltransferase involved in cell wall biosynthesis
MGFRVEAFRWTTMRILLVSSSSGSRGGGELFLVSLGRALSELGHDTMLWASTHHRMDELCARFQHFGKVYRSEYRNTYDRRLRALSAALDLGTAVRLMTDWRRLKPDVIHLNKQNLEDGLEFVWAANLSRIPSICSIHVTQNAAYLKARLHGVRNALSRFILQQYHGWIVAPGNSRLTDLQTFLGRNDRTTLVQNGVPIPALNGLSELRSAKRKELNIRGDQLLCVAVGRMVEQKRPLLFLDLAGKIASLMPQTVFCWVGDGPLRSEWNLAAAKKGLANRVFVTGWVGEVQPFYAAADLFLHTAAYEGLPLALLEAMAAGLPCVLTPNLLEDLKFLDSTATVATDESSHHWIQSISDPGERRRLGSGARNIAVRNFSVARMARDYELLYEKVTSGAT